MRPNQSVENLASYNEWALVLEIMYRYFMRIFCRPEMCVMCIIHTFMSKMWLSVNRILEHSSKFSINPSAKQLTLQHIHMILSADWVEWWIQGFKIWFCDTDKQVITRCEDILVVVGYRLPSAMSQMFASFSLLEYSSVNVERFMPLALSQRNFTWNSAAWELPLMCCICTCCIPIAETITEIYISILRTTVFNVTGHTKTNVQEVTEQVCAILCPLGILQCV